MSCEITFCLVVCTRNLKICCYGKLHTQCVIALMFCTKSIKKINLLDL